MGLRETQYLPHAPHFPSDVIQVCRVLQEHEFPVGFEVAIKGNRVFDSCSIHYHEAECVAEGVFLIGMVPKQFNGSNLVSVFDSHYVTETLVNGIYEQQSEYSAISCALAYQGVRFPYQGVCRD